MSINKNLMNPVPLHTSMDDWYDKKNTYRGRKSNVIYPTNRIPPMMLTFDSTHSSLGNVSMGITLTESSASRNVTLSGNLFTPEAGFSYTDSNNAANNVTLSLIEAEGGYKIELTLGLYRYQVINTDTSTATSITESMLVFTESMLNATSVRYAIYDGTTYYGILRLTTPLLYATLSSGISVYVVNCSSDATTGTSVSLTTTYIGSVPPSYRTSSRYGWMWLGGESVTGFSSGDYFLRVTFDGTDYYGEPFSWLTSNSEWLTITYRRSVPVVRKLNYMSFGGSLGKSLEMYIPATMIKPPYTFDSEVADLDGWKFVQKQVSYHLHKVSFVCSQYFAEAIRLLWHCNDITISQDGESTEVDYMEPPEVDWGEDAHLCEVTLQFQSDTIVQTNGETGTQSHISSGTTFNGSFDESFS